MPHSPNIHSYSDIAEQLEELLSGGGGTVAFETSGQATVWRARAYKYRALLRDNQRDPNVPNYVPSTPYDKMIIHKEKDGTEVEVRFERPKTGVITTLKMPTLPVTPLNDAPGFDPEAAMAAAEALLTEEKK